MSKLYVLIGVSKSGKTRLCENSVKNNENSVHISSDNIREELFESSEPEDYNPKDNNIVFQLMFERTVRELLKGKTVYYDATNLVHKRRKHFVEQVRNKVDNVEVTALLVTEEIETLLERAEKDGFPKEVIMKQLSSFQMPTNLVFDSILLKSTPDKDIFDYLKMTEGFDQLTPYHDFTLETHIKNCYWKAFKRKLYRLEQVALWHDIGKLYTQKVNEEGVASYPNHANVSAYLFLNSLNNRTYLNLNEGFDVAGVIQEHMNYKFIKTEKAKNKLLMRSRGNEKLLELFKDIDETSQKEGNDLY